MGYNNCVSLLAHLVLLLLGFTEGDVLQSCLLVETPAAELAFGEMAILGGFQNLFLLLCGLVIVVATTLYACSQSQRLCFPLRNLLFSFLLFEFLLNQFSLFHQFLLLVGDQTLFLCVELFAFLLEDLSAHVFVFGDAVGVELSAASFAALDQL